MNSIKLLLSLFVLCFLAGLKCQAETTFPLIPPTEEGPDEEIPGYIKHKTPPAPVLCFIDFEAGTVSFSSEAVGEIEEYLICNESGENCISSYDDPAEFVAALNALNGDLCIKFLSPKGYYTGFITK